MSKSTRTLIIVSGSRTFRIDIPDDARVEYQKPEAKNPQYVNHTLKVFSANTENQICAFSDVSSFREMSVNFMEQIAKEEGATMWKSDQSGYVREEKNHVTQQWVAMQPALPKGSN